jgi:hypothetical protein
VIRKEKQKGHYDDEEALVGWNSTVLLAKVWSELCEQKPFICPSVNSNVIGPSVRVWDTKGQTKGLIWWICIDWLKWIMYYWPKCETSVNNPLLAQEWTQICRMKYVEGCLGWWWAAKEYKGWCYWFLYTIKVLYI